MRRKFVVVLLICLCRLCGLAAERDVTVVNRSAGVELGGTLTLPAGKPRAALVLATGSGAQNRDEEILGHKPFKVIADRLGEAGYAVLRMDDRGVGSSTGDATTTTTADYASDLRCALASLDSLVGDDVPRGVLGHSEGGSAAIMLGADSACSFIITLAAPAWPGDSIIMSQSRVLATSTLGGWEAEGQQRRLMDLVKSPMSDAMLQPLLYATIAGEYGEAASMPAVQTQLNAVAKAMCSPSYRYIVKYDPAAAISAVGVPWLALQGSKDTQVLVGNIDTICRLNPSVVAVVLEGHNHLFQRCTTGLVNEYATIGEDISEETLQAILEFLSGL